MRLEGKPVSDEIDSATLGWGDLVVVMVQAGADDEAYLRAIERKGEKLGTKVEVFRTDDRKEAESFLVKRQLLPYSSNVIVLGPADVKRQLAPWIIEDKDVDNVSGKNRRFPCTAQAILELLDYYGINVAGKDVVIVNRSQTVGRPLAKALLDMDATVTVCHSKSENLYWHTCNADIVITATGNPKLFDTRNFNRRATVIDVAGDVDFDSIMVANYATMMDVGRVTTSVLMSRVS